MRIVVVCAASAVATVKPSSVSTSGAAGGGEVVHEPHRVEPGGLGGDRPFEDAVERHPELREIDAKPRIGHGGGR